MIIDRVRLLMVTVWVGSLWTVGYLVAPTLFATLADRVLAGVIAGNMFRVEAWVSLVCGAALLIMQIARPVTHEPKRWIGLIVGMLVCTLIGHFVLQPMMEELKLIGIQQPGPAHEKFAMLHGISSSVYLFQSLLAALLMFRAGAKSS